MPLPILTHRAQPSDADLVRLYHRCELHWCRQVADEETQLDAGTALTNAQLDRVHDANTLMDAAIPAGVTAADVVAQVETHFEQKRTRCWKWVTNPSSPAEQTTPLAEHLLAHGYEREAQDILYLRGRPAAIDEVGGITLIPARAALKLARKMEEQDAARWNDAQIVDARILHLEDPQSDSVLALKDGAAAGVVTVLTVGDIGFITNLFVPESLRGQGIGRTLMSRALEICARSLFKHVLLGVRPDNDAAQALYRRIGFAKVGEFVFFRAKKAN